MNCREVLKKVDVFRDLNQVQADLIAPHCIERKALEGERIISEGEHGESMFLLVDGAVEISKKLTLLQRGEADLRDKKLTVLKAGPDSESYPVFGEMGLFAPDERSATVTAVTTCTLLEIRGKDFLAICEKDCRLGYLVTKRIVQIVSERIRQTNKDVLKLTTALCLALEST
ncbi:MAG: cyclic nucleotide-binding domain-containing protein [bacterium]|jgi:CRP-like cAMP-binding protein